MDTSIGNGMWQHTTLPEQSSSTTVLLPGEEYIDPIQSMDVVPLSQSTSTVWVFQPCVGRQHDTALIWLFHLLNTQGSGPALTSEEIERYRPYLPFILIYLLECTLANFDPAETFASLEIEHKAEIEAVMEAARRTGARDRQWGAEDAILFEAVKSLWYLPQVQRALNERICREAFAYFNGSIARILAQNYTPTPRDTFYAHLVGGPDPYPAFDLRVTSIDEPSRVYAFLSSAGTRGYYTQKKLKLWLEDIDAVLFIADLCDYDNIIFPTGDYQNTEEKCNRLNEVIQVGLGDRLNSKIFGKGTVFLMLLNNLRQFKSKLQSSPFKEFFADYADYEKPGPGFPAEGSNHCSNGIDERKIPPEVEFLIKQILSMGRKAKIEREIYVCVLDDIEDERSWDFVTNSLKDVEAKRKEREDREMQEKEPGGEVEGEAENEAKVDDADDDDNDDENDGDNDMNEKEKHEKATE